jgi:hypothetical protein
MAGWSTEQQRREVEQAGARAVEILESFRAVNWRQCDELLACLGKLGPEGFCLLFGSPLRKPTEGRSENPNVAAEPVVTEVAPAPYKSYLDMTVPERMLHDLKHARHDEFGRRLNPGQSAFEPIARGSERPRPRSTHWSN